MDKAYKTDGVVSVTAFEKLTVVVALGYDWTPAIQEAVNTHGIGELLLPPGEYLSSNIDFTSKKILK